MRVLAVHPDFNAGGGAEVAAQRLIERAETLGARVDRLDINGLARQDGASAKPLVPAPLARRCPTLLAYALACRQARRIAAHYDRILWTFGEGPETACPALCWHHAPAIFDGSKRLLRALTGQERHGPALWVRQAYVSLCRRIAGISQDCGGDIRRLANSRWTADIAGSVFQEADFSVLYPPINGELKPFRRIAGSCRLVILGRLVANKRVETAIEVTAILRQIGIPAHLDIIGRGKGRVVRRLKAKAGALAYVTLHQNAPDARRRMLLRRADFAIHAFQGEHFGIAAAEQILAGTLPLVYDDGGICELVTCKCLRFQNALDAARKITALVLEGPDVQAALLRKLQNGEAFGAARNFDEEADRILSDWLFAAKPNSHAA